MREIALSYLALAAFMTAGAVLLYPAVTETVIVVFDQVAKGLQSGIHF